MGRPSGYNEDVQARADEYVAGGFEDCGDAVPSVSGLADELGVSRECLYEWGRNYPAFSDTLGRVKQKQERVTLAKGLQGEYNAALCKLILANHGYSERLQQEHSGPDGGPIQTHSTLDPSNLSDQTLAELMEAKGAGGTDADE